MTHRTTLIAPPAPCLSQLDLRGNGLGNDGAIIIGRGLRTAESKVLGELDLGYNEIKDDGACALAQVRGSASGGWVLAFLKGGG